eukprot:CAMPEP_0197324674 /NCGR_PEP_ID=MMETSP0891-20130614/71239_1 /TAXON_ID=44058 ORGANISM="Aureoumbra lagunensis, Strain CCMP1510" /NCGR_SAMPLE_ID=MMETSP0891 /ASSEMBLY_ACC=CAM_ASM_000534 /LENGTH=188 /DNA_ID=CAMNT_0042817517 /DNA_START=839 /DNA_END=1405 /DNA_ORIENTATION=+
MVTPEDETNEEYEDDEPIDDVFFHHIPVLSTNNSNTSHLEKNDNKDEISNDLLDQVHTPMTSLTNNDEDTEDFNLTPNKYGTTKVKSISKDVESQPYSAKVHPIQDKEPPPQLESAMTRRGSTKLQIKKGAPDFRELMVNLVSVRRDLQKTQSDLENLHDTVNSLVDTQLRLLKALEQNYGITPTSQR